MKIQHFFKSFSSSRQSFEEKFFTHNVLCFRFIELQTQSSERSEEKKTKLKRRRRRKRRTHFVDSFRRFSPLKKKEQTSIKNQRIFLFFYLFQSFDFLLEKVFLFVKTVLKKFIRFEFRKEISMFVFLLVNRRFSFFVLRFVRQNLASMLLSIRIVRDEFSIRLFETNVMFDVRSNL